MKNRSALKNTLLVFIMVLTNFHALKAQNWNELIKATASDASGGHQFGRSVSISGNKAIVGAFFNNGGAAYIFELVGTSWVETTKITASDAAAGDWFGVSVSISGNKAIVGAAMNDDNGNNSGSAYIFELVGTSWIETSKITASDAAANDNFGCSVSISGNKAIVGAEYNDDNGTDSGSGYIFDLVGTSWLETTKITASDASAGDRFGISIGISGNAAIIGAEYNNSSGSNSGAAYIFDLVGASWLETTKINALDASFNDHFGNAVSISGNKAIVGAHQKSEIGFNNIGAAYIFEKVGNLWSQSAKLTPLDAFPGDFFGGSVGISGNKAIVGAHLKSGAVINSGAAYVYEQVGASWPETAKIIASDQGFYDFFGLAASISGNYAIVGAMQNSDHGAQSGSAYIFGPCPLLLGTETASACNSYVFNGLTYTTSNNTAKDTLTHANGCDSIVTLNLTINSNSDTITASACNSYVFNGVTYTASNNTAKYILTNVAGCDSTVRLNLTINKNTGTETVAACNSYVFNGITYTSNNNTAKDTLTNNAGCDSIVTLNLTIYNINAGTKTVSACDSYIFNGITYTSNNNTAQDTLINAGGCDSIVTLNLTINNSNSGIQIVSTCDSYVFNGINYTSNNNTATDTLTTVNGCDSIVTLNLTINNSNSGTETISTCNSYIFNGITYTSNNNTATDTLTNVAGCDSIVTLNLTINNNTGIETASVCNNYLFNGVIYTVNNNTALDTLTNFAGCDSIITLNLTINNSTGIETASVCDSYVFNDITYTANNNTALDTLTNFASCDSIVTLNLTINNSTSGTKTISACNSYVFNGTTYTANNNTALDTLTNAAGCDSIVTLNLTLNNSNTGTETVMACDSYFFNGTTYTTNNNTALDTLTNVAGCDSLVTLNLTINSSSVGIETVSACNNYVFNGVTYTSNNNTATDTLTNFNSCDSIVTLNLTVNSLNALSPNVSNDTLTALSQVGASYQWLDCSDNSIISGATDTIYIATVNGDYAVIATLGSCSDTSTCSNVIITGINNYQNSNKYYLYPNPTKSEVTITHFKSSITNLEIMDITGKVIDSFKPKTAIIDLSSYNKGIYFVRIQNGKNITTEKIIKQ